ncbi:MAG: SpoIIE family protein phosphatase [Verrucomicrobia bacterium]|nr:SpoIIE family protein phosphatase [Verrucomicrobiota bacterium]
MSSSSSSASPQPQPSSHPTALNLAAVAPLFFRRLMESLPDHIYFKDTEGRFLAISHALASAFGLVSPEQAVGKTDFDFFEKSLARQKFADERDVIRTGLGFIGKEERSRSGAGKTRWVMTSKQPLLGDNGEIIGTFGISRDINEMKMAREALEAHHRLLETLIDILPCRIFIKDDEGRLRLTNVAYREAVGIKNPSELEGRRLDELLKDPRASKSMADDEDVLEHGRAILNREEYDASPLGDKRWMLLSKVPLRDADGQIQGIVGMAADITMQKEAEARALQAQRELEAKNQQMEAELAVARELQTELMSSSMQSVREELGSHAPFVPGIGFHYEPCEYLAGDFFQAIPYSNTSFGLLLCDVMGHGVKAALVTTLIRGLLSDVRSKQLNPAQVLEHLNERLCPLLDRPPLPRFVTALYGRVDLAAGTIDLANAGHPWPLLQRQGIDTAPITDEQCGPALGFMRGATYTSTTHTLTKQDRLLLFTDGWTEEPNAAGEEFGTARLLEALGRLQKTPVENVLATIAGEITAFSGKTTRGDDLCGVLLEI